MKRAVITFSLLALMSINLFSQTKDYDVFEHNISRFQNELKDREKDIDDTIFIAEYKKIISDIVHTRNEQQVD
jgi:hypothetical protein